MMKILGKKCQVDETNNQWNVELTKWQNKNLVKCRVDETKSHRYV